MKVSGHVPTSVEQMEALNLDALGGRSDNAIEHQSHLMKTSREHIPSLTR